MPSLNANQTEAVTENLEISNNILMKNLIDTVFNFQNLLYSIVCVCLQSYNRMAIRSILFVNVLFIKYFTVINTALQIH